MSDVSVGEKVLVVCAQETNNDYKNGDVAVVCWVGKSGDAEVRFEHYTYESENGSHYLYAGEYCVLHELSTLLPLTGVKTASIEHVPTNTAESLRQNILSIRSKREEIVSQLKSLDAQESEAVEQLKKLGFSLFEESFVNSSLEKTVLYAEDIEEDIADPYNWKAGDLVKVEGSSSEYCKDGDVFEINSITDCGWIDVLKDSTGTGNSINPRILRFHSRPVK